jgi:hypothetical protein
MSHYGNDAAYLLDHDVTALLPQLDHEVLICAGSCKHTV